MVVELLEKDILIGGYDTGNNKLKVSFLDAEGSIQSFSIPTVIADAPMSKVDVSSSKGKVSVDTDLLHVRIKSNSLGNKDNNKAWYTGVYAKNKNDKIEPKVDSEGKTEEKLSDSNKKLHLIPLFTGMAVAAIRSGKTKVKVPFSGGMPIEDFKSRGENYILDMIYGEHIVEFLDGVYEGKTVTIIIENGSVHVEGVHSILALMFDISRGEIVEVPEIADQLGDNFAINDLGAGTTDKALFENGVLNKELSTNSNIGTNKYIDEILESITAHEDIDKMRPYMEDGDTPYKTREELVKTLIMPEVSKLITNPNYEPKFIANWGPVKNVDVTNIVIDGMKRYADEQIKDLMKFWINAGPDKMIVVGGGVLFGFIGFKELQKEHADFLFPKNLEDSPYFTSRSYLIANYMEQTEVYESVQA